MDNFEKKISNFQFKTTISYKRMLYQQATELIKQKIFKNCKANTLITKKKGIANNSKTYLSSSKPYFLVSSSMPYFLEQDYQWQQASVFIHALEQPKGMHDCKYDDDGQIIESKDFIPRKQYVENGKRYWIRSFFEFEKEKKLIIPITFLVDTGCPFNMIISQEIWRKLVQVQKLREMKIEHEDQDQFGYIQYLNEEMVIRKSKYSEISQNYHLNLLGGDLIQMGELHCKKGTFDLKIPQFISFD